MFQPNLTAVIIAGVVYFIIGGLWYSVLFGKQWLDVINLKMEDLNPPKPITMVGVFASGLLIAYILAHIVAYRITYTNYGGIAGGMTAAFWVWLGGIALPGLNGVVYENRTWKLYAINMGHYFVAYLTMGGILAYWQGV